MKKICFCLMLFLISFIKVDASICSDEVIKEASKVKVEVKAVKECDDFLNKVLISNVTENLYVEVYEDDDDTVTVYTHADVNDDGVISIDHWYIYENVNYEVSVYSNNDGCYDKLNTLKATTLKFNKRYNFVICEKNPDYEKCDPFYQYTNEDKKLNDEEFYNEMEEFYEEKNAPLVNKFWKIVKEYYLYVLIPFLVIGGSYLTAILIYKHKRRSEDK